jgi:ABC-type lipoprotein release transport system permease subunit
LAASALGGPVPTLPLVAAAALVISTVALTATYLPARRATRSNPFAALREE